MNTNKKIILSYVVFLHLLIVVMLLKSDFINKVEVQLGVLPQELTPHFERMLATHIRMDSLIPDGATIFIGDSIAQGLATSAISCLSVNYGVGSDTTVGVLKRLLYYNSMKTAKAVVLAIGVNDLGRRENPEILENYRAILSNIPSETKVVVSAVLPIDDNVSPANSRNSRISDLNTSLEILVSEYPNSVFVNAGASLKDNSGNLKPEYHTGDGVHLSQKGYLIWMSSLKEGLSGGIDARGGG